MSDFPPMMRDQRLIDDDQLRVTAAFHFAFAGLAVLGIIGLIVSYFMIDNYLSTPDLWRIEPMAPPEHVLRVQIGFAYAFAVFVLVGVVTCNIASGVCIRQRKYRMFSLAIAALNSLLVPVGTALACYTYVVLMRDSVRDTYPED